MSAQMVMPTGIANHIPLLDVDAHEFRRNFNRVPFEFPHPFVGHPLFQLPRLLELSKTLPDSDVYYDAGDIRVEQRWDQVPRSQLSVDQLIDRIENAGAWIVLKRAHQVPEYGAILDRWLAEVRAIVGAPFPKITKKRSAAVVITSPNRVTSYHMDADCNFLCQIQGTKVIHVFDQNDRDVLPEVEIERFWAGDRNAAIHKPQYQQRAKSHELKPGTGVHLPVHAPHWVQNDNNVSISFSMFFVFPDSEFANMYRWNHYLRKMGVTPLPPGQSNFRDALKNWTMSGVMGIRNTMRTMLGRT